MIDRGRAFKALPSLNDEPALAWGPPFPFKNLDDCRLISPK